MGGGKVCCFCAKVGGEEGSGKKLRQEMEFVGKKFFQAEMVEGKSGEFD